jgi:hypothetical protein
VRIAGTISPGNRVGALTVGDATWAEGGRYFWEIEDVIPDDATGGWDRLLIHGKLTVAASAARKFTIDIASLAPGTRNEGDAADFSADSDYRWVIASATEGIRLLGRDAFEDRFELNPAGFSHERQADSADGAFSIAVDGNDVVLLYRAAKRSRARQR